MSVHEYGDNIMPQKWLVKNLIPHEAITIIEGKSFSRKSTLMYTLAVAMTHSLRFLDRTVVEGDVLLIDQDTPEHRISRQLNLARKYHPEAKQRYNIIKRSFEELYLSDGSLINQINEDLEVYPNIKLIVIDCLTGICGTLNPNSTKDMNRLRELSTKVLKDRDLSIILIVHISEKKPLYLRDFTDKVDTLDAHVLAMGNSTITNFNDYIMILVSEDDITGIYIVPKRAEVKQTLYFLKFIANKNGISFEVDKSYKTPQPAIKVDIMKWFRDNSTNQKKHFSYVSELIEEFHKLYRETSIRICLKNWKRKNC